MHYAYHILKGNPYKIRVTVLSPKYNYRERRGRVTEDSCNPTYGRVDELLELLTKSKSLHILLVIDRKNGPVRFSDLKKLVDASSTTVSRRLKELEAHNLVHRTQISGAGKLYKYSITEDAKSLSPIIQSLYDWVERIHS